MRKRCAMELTGTQCRVSSHGVTPPTQPIERERRAEMHADSNYDFTLVSLNSCSLEERAIENVLLLGCRHRWAAILTHEYTFSEQHSYYVLHTGTLFLQARAMHRDAAREL